MANGGARIPLGLIFRPVRGYPARRVASWYHRWVNKITLDGEQGEMAFYRTRIGDANISVEGILMEGQTVIDLTTATEVELQLFGTGPLIRTATILDAAAGHVQYLLTAADLATDLSVLVPGRYGVAWHVRFSDGTEATFPTSGNDYLIVEENIA